MKRLRLTALEFGIAAIPLGVIGLCVLIIPSPTSPPISAALAIVATALAAAAYRSSYEEIPGRSTATAGAVIGLIVLIDIGLGLGTIW